MCNRVSVTHSYVHDDDAEEDDVMNGPLSIDLMWLNLFQLIRSTDLLSNSE